MELLGCALNLELAKELRSVPGTNRESAGENLLFDGAAIGQYLLGVDPIHTSGSVVGGYQNSDYPIELSGLDWSIPNPGKLIIGYQGTKYDVLSIHAHSKENLGPPDMDNARWKQIISEANLEVTREVILRDLINIHQGNPSLCDRIRIARKNGFHKHLQKYLTRRLERVVKKQR
jgi:hypothetical protein